MRILKVYDGDFPWDVRVEKIVCSLIAAGHDVRLVCRNQRADPRRETLPDGLELARLPAIRGPLTMPLFFNPIWAWSVAREIRRYRPDVLMVRDLPLAPLVVALASRAGVPVVVDYSEPYPESLRSQRQFDPRSVLHRLIRNPEIAEWLERYVVRHANSVWVPCDEAMTRLIPQGLREGQAVEVGNTPRLDHFSASDPSGSCESVPGLDAPVPLIFSGLLAGDRGLDVAIDAMALLEARRPGHFSLVIIGDGPMRESLESQTRAHGLEKRVHLTGFIDYDRLPAILIHARIGLLPFHSCPHIEHTLANKLFEYMALGLPVVVSDARPMVRVLSETSSGLSFPAGDAQALAATIESLADDEQRLAAMSRAGKQVARARYHWGMEEVRLLQALEELS